MADQSAEIARIMALPRNPARMPQGVEDFAQDAVLGPLWDAAKGIGATATGNWNSPEGAGAGLMAAMGMMSPSARGVRSGMAAADELRRSVGIGERGPWGAHPLPEQAMPSPLYRDPAMPAAPVRPIQSDLTDNFAPAGWGKMFHKSKGDAQQWAREMQEVNEPRDWYVRHDPDVNAWRILWRQGRGGG